MSTSNRGKWAEGVVRDCLKAIEEATLRFTFNRIPDAHAAAGRFPAQAGDFQWFYAPGSGSEYSRNGVIEVKEVDHEYRLPHKNFDADAVGRMRKRQLAGCETLVLVAFKTAGLRGNKIPWRAFDLDYFTTREGGSWDMRDTDYIDVKTKLWEIVR